MELLKRLYAINSKSGREDEIKRFILSSLSHITLDIKEDEFLHAIFAYLNTLQDISAQFIDRMSEVIDNKI